MYRKGIMIPQIRFAESDLSGSGVEMCTRTLGDIAGIYEDKDALAGMDLCQTAYDVASYLPVEEGTPGGLYIGVTYMCPGKVGDEYFMTKGHFHKNEDTAEFYWGVEGEGMLIMMDRDRNVWAEKMFPGSLHYIPGKVAHRVANIGKTRLAFAACWPSDAGHNYAEIADNGFAKRLKDVGGKPELV